MLEIRIPDWLEFSSKGQALKYGEQAEVSVFLKAEAIFLLFDGSKEKILPQQTELYQFSYLKEKTYDRLGPPLSPEDIDHLVEAGELEQVLFSEKYILTEDDYQEFSGNLMEAFQELEKEYGPPPREKEQQDSLAQVAKDIVKMKASVFMLKVVQFAGALLVPLFSILLVVAIPVVIIFFLLYCSPLGAFMPNPSEENPTVREVLSGYYMDFNTKLGQNGEDGAVTYLHEKNGNYVSNYYDTLMVYMVKYGTGDIGVDMDQRHKDKLKEIFDEMNSFENTTITTTIKAGESLGNVVTSGYCQCSICCGQWAGGPTASGVMPKPDHTLAVDAQNPFVPMGTRIIMNGIEYTVEDTGAFDRYGVQFDVFCADHATASAWGHQTFEAFLADGDENEITVTKKGCYVKNLNYEDYIALGKLTEKEEELLREVMSEEFRNEIPSFGVGSDVANLALTKVGCKYSQEHRYEEGYYDCSSLVQRLYQEVGISLPAIASTQGEFMVTHGLEVTEGELEPGDLIFYSYEQNGQFRNISHVAIYVGNGRMVHAANSRRGVVNDPFNPSNIGLYGRPSRLQ